VENFIELDEDFVAAFGHLVTQPILLLTIPPLPGATTLRITTFGIMTLSIMTLSITSFSIMTLSIGDSQDNDTKHR
jgi:hypothetical protein